MISVRRIFMVILLILLIAPSRVHTQDDLRTEQQEIRQELVERLTPTEANFLERINALEKKQNQKIFGFSPEVVSVIFNASVPILVVIVASVFSWVQSRRNQHQQTWQFLVESLRWFEGGTQKRSIGIALVKSKWQEQKKLRSLWASILVNQAIYLLTRKQTKDKEYKDVSHEQANLYRIMDFLIKPIDKNGYISDSERRLLCETLKNYKSSDPNLKLRNLDPERLEEWREHFNCKPQIKFSLSDFNYHIFIFQ